MPELANLRADFQVFRHETMMPQKLFPSGSEQFCDRMNNIQYYQLINRMAQPLLIY
jgi:hypothetical protein